MTIKENKAVLRFHGKEVNLIKVYNVKVAGKL